MIIWKSDQMLHLQECSYRFFESDRVGVDFEAIAYSTKVFQELIHYMESVGWMPREVNQDFIIFVSNSKDPIVVVVSLARSEIHKAIDKHVS